MRTPALSDIPAVDEVLRCETGTIVVARFGRSAATAGIRRRLAAIRSQARNGGIEIPSAHAIGAQVLETLEAEDLPSVRPVFNLTGVVLHTNLGRAILADEAVAAANRAMGSAVALEFDIDSGGRGERDDHIRPLICELTGAEDAIVVNNNAAAALAGSGDACSRQRNHRLARRTDRNRRRVPHARDHAERRHHSARSRHYQPHPSARLRRSDRSPDGAVDESAHVELRDPGLYRRGRLARGGRDRSQRRTFPLSTISARER